MSIWISVVATTLVAIGARHLRRKFLDPKPTMSFLKPIGNQNHHAARLQILRHLKSSVSQLKDQRELFNALGALSGFAVQISIWFIFVKGSLLPMNKALNKIETIDGRCFYFGPLVESGLYGLNEEKPSPYMIITYAAVNAGVTSLPNAVTMRNQVAATIGTPEFGLPQLPFKKRATGLPVEIVKSHWHAVQAIFERELVSPYFWGSEIAFIAAELLQGTKKQRQVSELMRLFLAAMMPMAWLDPGELGLSFPEVANV